MDKENVITVTGDLDALNKDMVEWQAMPFDLRKKADDACILKYGRNNTELYILLKKNIELATQDTTLEEGFSEEEFNDRLYKINLSNELMYNNGEVIINPWIIDDDPDYGIEELTKKYNAYLGLFDDHKTQSDFDSQRLWGHNVHDMYNIMLSKLRDIKEMQKEKDSLKFSVRTIDHTMQEQLELTEASYKEDDMLHRLLMKLDNVSLYENSDIYDGSVDRLVDGYDKNSYADYDEDIPMITPWFTPDEYQSINHTEINPYEYIFDKDQKVLNDDIKKAMYELSIASESDREAKTEAVLKLGWNPSIEYTGESIKHARQRQVNWFNENKQVCLIDLSKYNNNLSESVLNEVEGEAKSKKDMKPVYIVLIHHDGINNKVIGKFTKSKFSHSGLSLDESMTKIYSFNQASDDGTPGFSIESLEFYKRAKNPSIRVMCIFVDQKVRKTIEDRIDYYIKNKKKSKYDLVDLFRVVFKKTKDVGMSLNMICSQFVDSCLKAVNIDITGKPSNLVSPADFERPKMPSKVFILFDGPVGKYKASELKGKVNKLLASNLNPEGLSIKTLTEAIADIFTKKDISEFYVKTGIEKTDAVLESIRDMITPTPVIEARHIPLRFSKKGDLYLDLPKDLEAEYQEAHRLLISYDESNIQGIKHQLARLFYLNSIIEKKIKKMKKDDPSYKKSIDLRARVLNDFKKYMKVVQQTEPEFDFEEYLKNSEYYNKTVKIDNNTMKYTGKTIKSVLKTMASFIK